MRLHSAIEAGIVLTVYAYMLNALRPCLHPFTLLVPDNWSLIVGTRAYYTFRYLPATIDPWTHPTVTGDHDYSYYHEATRLVDTSTLYFLFVKYKQMPSRSVRLLDVPLPDFADTLRRCLCAPNARDHRFLAPLDAAAAAASHAPALVARLVANGTGERLARFIAQLDANGDGNVTVLGEFLPRLPQFFQLWRAERRVHSLVDGCRSMKSFIHLFLL